MMRSVIYDCFSMHRIHTQRQSFLHSQEGCRGTVECTVELHVVERCIFSGGAETFDTICSGVVALGAGGREDGGAW